MRETRGYLEFVVDIAGKQLSQPSEGIPKVIAQLTEKALCIAKRWDKLHYKVKYWESILSIFSKPLACQTFDMVTGIIIWYTFHIISTQNICFAAGISRDDFLDRVIATPDTLIHPCVIGFEICLQDMWHHFLSRTHFWAHVESDPATFTSWRLAVLNEIWRHRSESNLIYLSRCWRNFTHSESFDFFFFGTLTQILDLLPLLRLHPTSYTAITLCNYIYQKYY